MANKVSPTKNKLAPALPATSYGAEDNKYRVKDALSTIMRAEEHRKDKPLMREVKKLAKQHADVCKKL